MMNLFFIYDVSSSDPDEDPKKFIIYCYPLQEIDSDMCMFICQIVGVSRFLKINFSSASVITLDSRCFVLCQVENYLLVLGGGENESCELLKMQMKLICRAFIFSHSSLRHVLYISNGDPYLFKKKLEEIWTPYLHGLHINQNVMQVYSKSMPIKIFSENTDAESSNLLNICEQEFEVLAGAVFCRKRLLNTQFSPDITTSLFLMTSQEELQGIDIPMKCRLPPGVKLKNVYLTQEQMKYLQKRRCQRFVKDRRKNFQTLPPNASSEADIDTDNHNSGYNRHLGFAEASQFLKFRPPPYGCEVSDMYTVHSIHVPCFNHAQENNEEMRVINKSIQQKLKETVDLEFQCFVCSKGSKCFVLSRVHLLSRLKRWNSEMDVMCFHKQQRLISKLLPFTCPKTTYAKKAKRKRSTLRLGKSKPNSFSSQESIKKIESRKRSSSLWTDFFYSPIQSISSSKQSFRQSHSPLWIIEELQHNCVLYVQKWGDCVLTLLLDSIPSSHLLLYIWHCGYLILPSIDFDLRNQSSSSKHKSDFNICTYKYKSQLLYGTLPMKQCPTDHVMHLIHEDFYSDPMLHSFSIVEPTRSICACNTKDKQIFYEQLGATHNKVNWFTQFWEKACRRTEKYLHISLPKNLI